MAPVSSELLTAGSAQCPSGTTNSSPVARVNLGGPAITAGGRAWSADPAVAPESASLIADTVDIRGTRADVLYRSAFTGEFNYTVAVPESGTYVTRLHLAEPASGADGRVAARGSRVFSVNLEAGRAELRRVDIVASARGSQRAVVKTAKARVTDGQLTIEGRGIVGTPLISGIEVLRQHPRGTCMPVAATAPAPEQSPSAEQTAEAQSAPEATTAPAATTEPEAGEQLPSASAEAKIPAPAETPAPSAGAQSAGPAAAAPASAAIGALTATSGRPFSASSAYNTPIPANPSLDPGSAAMIRSVTASNRATANLYAYGDPVFTADAGSPTATVDCTENWGSCDLEGRPIRIPADAQPTSGSDGRMIIVDIAAGTSCDFWQARKAGPGQWTVGWGTCAPLTGDGRGPNGGATGGGINTLAGVVRTFEMRNLNIPHAISIATNNSCAGVFRAPATKTDGQSSRSDCIPEGARLQLDPSIDVDAIPGITPGERAVAKALQTYGAINRDNCGANICVAFEAPIGEADPYPAVGFTGDYYSMPHIPWNRMRVVR
ncbi:MULTISPECIES: malectin domain-containing carbohydrate-binding protein [unclassified Blastococcus]